MVNESKMVNGDLPDDASNQDAQGQDRDGDVYADLSTDGVRQRTRIARELYGDIVQAVDFVLIIAMSIVVIHLYHYFYLGTHYELQLYATAGIIGATGYSALSRRDGYYDFDNLLTLEGSVRSILTQWITILFGLLAFGFALKVSESYSRIWFFSWASSTGVALILTRIAATLSLKKATGHNGVFSKRIAIVGANALGVKLADKAVHSEDPVTIVGIYDREESRVGAVKGLYSGGNLDALIKAARNDEIDDIIIAANDVNSGALKKLVRSLSSLPVSISLAPNENWLDHEGGELVTSAGTPLLHLYRRPLEGWGSIFKVLEDRILGAILLVLVSPIMLACVIAVKLQGKGPILFSQKRHGFNNEVFKIYKFRSMTVAEDGDTVVQAQKGDARVTPIGAFLRRYSLDELPQLLNVVKGNMSLVGPRPHALAHNHQYAKTVEDYSGRHKVKPGITGWAQVNGYRGETSENEMMEDRVKYDLEYIDNWSLYFDFKILILTVAAVLFPKNAY